MSCLTYIWYAGFYGLSQNTIVPSLAILTSCLLGYVSSTSSASTMPEYCFAFFGYIDTLPLELFASWANFASWATLPLGLPFASWACLLGYFCLLGLPLGLLLPFELFRLFGLYIDTLPLRLCLIDIVSFDNAGILICLLGCAITRHLLICNMISYVNMLNRDILWNRIWQKIWYLLALRSMSRYITKPELAITEGIIECRDMLACRNKRRYELFERCLDMVANRNKRWLGILVDAMICRHTEIPATQDIT
jgi:hypothetical protein